MYLFLLENTRYSSGKGHAEAQESDARPCQSPVVAKLDRLSKKQRQDNAGALAASPHLKKNPWITAGHIG